MDQTQIEQFLTHYFRTVWEAAGLKWTSENYAEMSELARLICAK